MLNWGFSTMGKGEVNDTAKRKLSRADCEDLESLDRENLLWTCSAIRHLVTNCFGYKHCARCGVSWATLSLDWGFPRDQALISEIDQACDCAECRQSFDTAVNVDR